MTVTKPGDMGAEDEVARVVWPWRGGERSSSRGRLLWRRARVLLQAVPALAIASVLYFRFDLRTMAYAIAGIAAIVVVCGFCLPGAYRVIERIQSLIGRAVGSALTVVLLGAVFALCFIPGRLILALRRRDPMRREDVGPDECLWIPHPGPADPDRYKRQY